MFEGINEIAVLVTTILAVAVGSVWYSPAVFGGPWMRSIGMTDETMAATKDTMSKLFVLATLINFVLMSTLAFALKLIPGQVFELAGVLAGVTGLFVAGGAIWEGRGLTYVVISLGYILTIVYGGLSVLAYWPW